MSIRTFPSFSFLDLHDRNEFESLTQNFPPYSDYVFSSLYAWDVNATTEISRLGDNLIVKFPDYISAENVYAFLGTDNAAENAEYLLDILSHDGPNASLQLVPEETIRTLTGNEALVCSEDRDNFDYVYDTNSLVTLEGKHYARKRNLLSGFARATRGEVIIRAIDFSSSRHLQIINDINHVWALHRNKSPEETANEFTAISRILRHAQDLDIEGIIIYHKEKPIAYTLYEQISPNYFIGHFEKSDGSLPGAYAFLRHEVANIAHTRNVTYINGEQDLGIASLRHAKESYSPVGYLKKYSIKRKRR